MLEKMERYVNCLQIRARTWIDVFVRYTLPPVLKQSTALLESKYFQNANHKLLKLGEFQRKVKQRVERSKRKELSGCPVAPALPVVSEVRERWLISARVCASSWRVVCAK